MLTALLYRFRKNAAGMFLICYLVFGCFYFAAVPLFKAPDEPSHMMRAYEVSMGYLLSDMDAGGNGGRELSYNLNPEAVGIDRATVTQFDVWERYGEERLSDQKQFLIYWNTALYAPVSYLPQALGMLLMRLFTDRIVLIACAGRLAGYLSVGLLGFFAVKYAPMGKRAMLLFLLLPMNMQEAVSLAPDAMVTALTCALLSFVLYMRYTKTEAMGKRHYVMLYLLCVLLGLYKIVYLPFCLFPFLIPKERFGGKRQYLTHALILGALVLTVSLGWLGIAGNYLSETWGADGDAQVRFILTQPLRYLEIMWDTWQLEGRNYLYNIVGRDFGWLSITVSEGLVRAYALICLAALLLDPKEAALPECYRAVRLTALAVVCSVILLTFTSIYVQWNVPQAETVLGIQGRYFIPLLFPIWLTLHGAGLWLREIIRPMRRLSVSMGPLLAFLLGLQLCICSDLFSEGIGEYGGGFREEAEGLRYWTAEDSYLLDTWYRLDGQWYYFDGEGYMLRNTWIEGAEGYYYLSDTGAMLTDTVTPDGWLVDQNGRRMGRWTK